MLVRCTPALRLGLIGLLLGAFTPAGSTPAAAEAMAPQEFGVFTVRNVEVDVTAGSANAAREQGIAEAQRKGWQMLLARIAPEDEVRAAGGLGAAELARLVTAFEVQEERTSAVRYVGKLTVRFDPAATRSELRGRGIRYTEVRSKPIVILPLDQTGGAPVLWAQDTPWHHAWAGMAPPEGLVPIIVPHGEAQDVADIDAAQALSADTEALHRIADRYGAGAVGVATADAGGGRLTVHRLDGSRETYTATGGLPAAAQSLVAQVEQAWIRSNLIAPGQERVLSVQVSFATMNDWLETRRRLSQVPTVRQAQVRSLSRGQAEVELTYVGDETQLRTALAQRDLLLGAAGPERDLRWRGASVPTEPGATPTAATPAAASPSAAAPGPGSPSPN
ncbi:DUF2066 domain-containing protein [Oleisolibacter albus]|uniref:DUF2066 domain-containing protein n=1 Tax=Oleisolibacter albus TaxID=2171757 RepID=UPI000DF43BDD|nr:DUF2066 domain-containing protein [Oleisolibacter albus]